MLDKKSIRIGDLVFSQHPQVSKEDAVLPYKHEQMWWSPDDINKLFEKGHITRTYYPAEFGRGINAGDTYKIHGEDGQQIAVVVSDLQTVESEYGEGLKITFKVQRGD